MSEQKYKTEGGKKFHKSDYAYTPSDLPSTWKLRLTSEPGGAPDSGIVGAAIAALGKGFRGQKVDIPQSAISSVKAKVKAAWKKANPGKSEKDMPDVIKESEDASLHQKQEMLSQGIHSKYGERAWVRDIWEDHLVFDMDSIEGSKLYDVSYTIGKDNEIKFGDAKEVKFDPQYIPVKESLVESYPMQLIPKLVESVDGSSGTKWGAVLIEAGMSANRHNYKPEVLAKAAPLFEGIKAYVDHPSGDERFKSLPERSVKDIAGWFTNVKYQEGAGITGIFNVAESQPWLKSLLMQMHTQNPSLIGFSIMADGKVRPIKESNGIPFYDVESIDRAFSCDLVTTPAAGGKIKELLESKQREVLDIMAIEDLTIEELAAKNPDLLKQIQEEITAKITKENVKVKDPPKEDVEIKEEEKVSEQEKLLQDELKKTLDAIKVSESKMALREMLSESDLPKVAKDRISNSFDGRIASREEIDTAIKSEKEFLGKLAESKDTPFVKQAVREMVAPQDTLSKALDGMFEGKAIDGVKPVRSLKEAYAAYSGRSYFDVNSEPGMILKESLGYGGGRIDSEGRLMESATTSTWAEVLGDSITRKLQKEYNMPGLDDWKKVCSEITSVNDFRTQRRGRLGGYGVLPSVNEGGVYQSLTTPGDEEITYAVSKYGGLEDLTIETIANDDMGAVKRIPVRLARAAKVTLYRYVFGLITGNPTQPDGTAAFHANHNNLGATALSHVTLGSARIAMRDQTAFVNTGSAVSSGTDFMMMKPKYILVPNELEETAWLLYNNQTVIDTVGGTPHTTNANFNKGACEPIVVDFWTDANDWYLVADPAYANTLEMAFFGGKQEPELFTQDQPTVGSVWSADKISYKIRHIYAGALLDWRSFYAAVVT